MRSARLLLATAALVAVTAVVAAVVLLVGGGEDEAPLAIARADGELLVAVRGAQAVRAAGAELVLQCHDAGGEVVVRRPATRLSPADDASGALHVHQELAPARLQAVERCTLEGGGVALSGRATAG